MSILKNLLLIAALSIFLVACKIAPLANMNNMPLTISGSTTLADITKGIIETGENLGWKMEEINPGFIVATLNQSGGKHVAIVNIKYDTTAYSITYRDSINLKHKLKDPNYDDKEMIHPAYNEWTERLSKSIQNKIF